jgi:proton-dependent oligopeptide transporter, POT family
MANFSKPLLMALATFVLGVCTLAFGFYFALGLLLVTVFGLQFMIWQAQAKGEKELFGHPLPLYMLFLTEMWERFSYYGMRGIFMLYMTNYLVLNSGLKAGIYGDYTGLVYITPLLGGFLADRYLGLQRSIIIGGIMMAIGQFCLSNHAWNDLPARPTWQTVDETTPKETADRIASERAERLKQEQAIGSKVGESLTMLFLGAGLLILGNGMFKPNISTIVGQLYEPSDPRRDAGFTIFYMGINVGAFFSPIICGYLAQEVKWQYGFVAAGVGMVLGTISFIFGRRMLNGIGLDPAVQTPPDSSEGSTNGLRALTPNETMVRTIIWAVMAVVLGVGIYYFAFPGESNEPLHPLQRIDPLLWSIAAVVSLWIYTYLQPRCTPTELGRVNALYVLAVFVMLFWAAFEQAGSSLTLFADQYTNNSAFGKAFPSSWWQSLNAIYIIALAPLFSAVWLVLNGVGREPSTPWKMTIGIAFNALSFAIVIPAAVMALKDPGSITKVGPGWLLTLYFLQTCGELCLSPVGLTMVTRLAPVRYGAMMMGMWFLVANAFGNKIAGSAAGYMDEMGPKQLFIVVTLILAGATVILPFLIPWLRKQMAGVK